MEAKICPDGSSVGRTLPNCEFAPCPQFDTPTVTNSPQSPALVPYQTAVYSYLENKHKTNDFCRECNNVEKIMLDYNNFFILDVQTVYGYGIIKNGQPVIIALSQSPKCELFAKYNIPKEIIVKNIFPDYEISCPNN